MKQSKVYINISWITLASDTFWFVINITTESNFKLKSNLLFLFLFFVLRRWLYHHHILNVKEQSMLRAEQPQTDFKSLYLEALSRDRILCVAVSIFISNTCFNPILQPSLIQNVHCFQKIPHPFYQYLYPKSRSLHSTKPFCSFWSIVLWFMTPEIRWLAISLIITSQGIPWIYIYFSKSAQKII